jgi:hypothetical protein
VEAKRISKLEKQDEKNVAEARSVLQQREEEMKEWDVMMEEEELSVQVSDIVNEGDNIETLIFGCAHCALGECIWLVHKCKTYESILDALRGPINLLTFADLHKHHRFTAYHLMARTISERGDRYVKLPGCVVGGVRLCFPEPSGTCATAL